MLELAAAQLAVLAPDPAIASKVPDSVHVAGNNVGVDEVVNMVVRVRDVPCRIVEVVDLDALSLLDALPEERV